MERKRVNDVFDQWANGGGIMSFLWRTNEIPWEDPETTPLFDVPYDLDLEYHGNCSGGKYISPLFERLLSSAGGYQYPDNEKMWIARTIVRMFAANWSKQWATLEFEYNPIDNYSMVEQMTNDQTIDAYGKTRTRTDNLSHTKTGTETDTPNTTETQTPNITNTRNAKTHGFNSVQEVPTDEDTQQATGTNTVTRTGQEQRTYNTTDADTGTQTENDGGQDTHTRNYRLTRSGNIGVTTSQQMIESERALWMWNFFRDVVFPDIDRVLTIQVY